MSSWIRKNAWKSSVDIAAEITSSQSRPEQAVYPIATSAGRRRFPPFITKALMTRASDAPIGSMLAILSMTAERWAASAESMRDFSLPTKGAKVLRLRYGTVVPFCEVLRDLGQL